MGRVHIRFRYLCNLWQQVAQESTPPQFDRWLVAYFKSLPQLGRRDRRWYSDMAFACMRYAAYVAVLSHWHDENPIALAESLTPNAQASWDVARRIDAADFCRRLIATLAVRGQLGESAANDADALASLGEAEVAKIRQLDDALARDGSIAARCLLAGVPPSYSAALVERSERSLGFDCDSFLTMQAKRPPLWLRLNDQKHASSVIAALRSEGYAPIATHATAIGLHGDVRLNNLVAYNEGQVEVQDLASQAIGDAVAPDAHHLIWDACAGGGGKTLQIAAQLRGRGAVYASDIRAYKLDEVTRRANRAGFRQVHTFVWDGASPPNLPAVVKAQGGFDRVLVDAPCTGSGTWRRSPDARFRATQSALAELTSLQQRILCAAEHAVRPGGLLIYGTCSWLVAENEAVIAAFQAACPRWHLQRQDLLGSPWLDSDTMFVAVLSKD